MRNPLKKKLVPIKELQEIRGVQLPVGLEFKQLVITGPPGAGKTYYINQIGGWPNEGYIDLTRKGWWKDQSLVYRPREINLGIPFKGIKEALTVFDKEWVDASPPLQLELDRIKTLPSKKSFLTTDWQNRYIFEFLIPKPEIIYQRRKARHKEGYFPVDANLTMDMVERQVADYREVALYLHLAGISVYIREVLEEPPMRIAEHGEVQLPQWTMSQTRHRDRLHPLAGWKRLFGKKYLESWVSPSTIPQKIERESRIPHDGKSFILQLGKQSLRLVPEIPLGASKRYLRYHKNWLITPFDIKTSTTITGFARLKTDETVMIGSSNTEYDNLFKFHSSVHKRHLNITNLKGDLIISPLGGKAPILVIRDEDLDHRERVENNRYRAMLSIKEIFGSPGQMIPPDKAYTILQSTIDTLKNEPYRPQNRSGVPGGLLELPDKITPIIIGDLHGQLDNLLRILSEKHILKFLQNNSAYLLFLGDAVHSEIAGKMDNMTDSILLMDLIFKLKLHFPGNVFYLRGNHDSFDPNISKNGYLQGEIMKETLEELRGNEYVSLMEEFFAILPYVAISKHFMACHAAPPLEKVNKDQITNITSHPDILHQIISKRVKRQNHYSGYTKKDVKRFRKAMGFNKNTPFIVGHTPLDPFGSIWRNVGNIKNHHIIYSAHQEGPSIFTLIHDQIQPLAYPAEPLSQLINDL